MGAEELYEGDHDEAEGDAGGLDGKVPCAGLELVEADFAECEVEYGEHADGEVVGHEGGEGGSGLGEGWGVGEECVYCCAYAHGDEEGVLP